MRGGELLLPPGVVGKSAVVWLLGFHEGGKSRKVNHTTYNSKGAATHLGPQLHIKTHHAGLAFCWGAHFPSLGAKTTLWCRFPITSLDRHYKPDLWPGPIYGALIMQSCACLGVSPTTGYKP